MHSLHSLNGTTPRQAKRNELTNAIPSYPCFSLLPCYLVFDYYNIYIILLYSFSLYFFFFSAYYPVPILFSYLSIAISLTRYYPIASLLAYSILPTRSWTIYTHDTHGKQIEQLCTCIKSILQLHICKQHKLAYQLVTYQ